MRDFKAKAEALVRKMTNREKALLLAGADFWHTESIPRVALHSVMVTDGPHGLRKQLGRSDHVGLNDSVPATCFPTASATACSFDPELLYAMGQALGEECRKEDVAVLLGPGANHKRSPLCGRNFEYFSEDPYLTGKMAAGLIRGVQSVGVGTSLKHFACNNQEKNRQTSDSIVDERALREIYLRGFEIAVREGQPWTIMTAYNRVNGTYAASNHRLMEEIARGEWGFQGLFMTDWGGMSDTVEGVAAGTDLEMPGVCKGGDELLLEALADGRLTQERLDDAACHVAELVLRYESVRNEPVSCDMAQHSQLARRIARESAVLLKNEGALPLPSGATVALLGGFAKEPRYQGSGSSRINPAELDNLLDALKESGADVAYSEGFAPEETFPREEKIAAAVALAAQRDAAVIVCGLPDSYESEGFDREHMWMPESHLELIRRVSAVNANTVVVLQCGSAVEMPWQQQPNAILLLHLSGQQGGHACADLLLGHANPCGKLAETYPLTLADNPSYPSYRKDPYAAGYWEGIYTGYRGYDALGKDVRYPFGHGLSYTAFSYDRLRREENSVYFRLKNIGTVTGKEIAQVYITKNGFKQLKGFAKVELAPGECREVCVTLDEHAFDYWNTDLHCWAEEGGEYRLQVGASSRDIRLEESVLRPEGTPPPAYLPPAGASDWEEFGALPGVKLPEPRKTRPFTPDSPVCDLQETAVGRVFVSGMRRAVGGMLGGEDVDRLVDATIMEMPLRYLGMSGFFTKRQVDGVIDFFNGKPGKGIRNLLKKAEKP